ncbi:hypothetical protein DACRYDRAFT_115222 [Dacryopinax primogenitus]|uniref:Sds3-like-domain-containing protein n=1 Tax=Dacryopinax primogenitus (strain DJM 731) TaxID=1858805 RepID=M5G6U8_DACPD|nr:uncharacterized protein DACRYDRAFT_115222 [Dacryopinax primogenitus]EJU03935.1 hypothetical protein DACRYDRAFT_115222 [Dacryopinax primogenitus]
MSPANSSALSDLSRSPSPVNHNPHTPHVPELSVRPPPSTQGPSSAPAGQSPLTLARRGSHESDMSIHSDGSSSLTNLSDEQPEPDADENSENEIDPERDGDADAKNAPTPEPVGNTPKRSVIPDPMWAWAAKKSKSKSKSKSKDTSEDEADAPQELESGDLAESDASDHRDKDDDEPSVNGALAVDVKVHTRTGTVSSRARANGMTKELAKLKAEDSTGTNATPTKSLSLSPISDADSPKDEDAKPEEDAEVQNDEEPEPAEQEAVAPVVIVEAFDRLEGMVTLTALEVALAMTRDYLYNTKMQQYAMEEEALNAGTHPELIHQCEELQIRKEARVAIAEKKYQAAVARIKRKRQEDAHLVMNTWRYERDELLRTMSDSYVSEKRALEREKANLERYSSPRPVTPPMPTEFVEEPPRKRVKVEKLVGSVTAKNVRKNIQSALTYPSVDSVSGDDLESDLIAMGIRRKPADPALGLLPPMASGQRDLLPVMPQPQGDYQQILQPIHQQYAHQAPLHIHHLHPPFPHTHQSHSSHLPPPSGQVISHHGSGSFPPWAPEPQSAYPSQQHHHHVQHNHPPSHSQALSGLPPHLQTQGPSHSPTGHRMNYLPSQPTTHTVLQSAERPPSSNMHISSNAQPFTAGPLPPNTWNEIRKDRELPMPGPSNHRHGRRSSPLPPHPLQAPQRDQSMFPPQGPPGMHNHPPPGGPPSSHLSSLSSHSGPPPPSLDQRRSAEHRASKSGSSKRKVEDEVEMRRDVKRPEMNPPPSFNNRSVNISPQDQRRDPGRSAPPMAPTYQQNTANILKERSQPWDQPPPPQVPTTNRVSRQGPPAGPPVGPISHNSLPPPPQNRQYSSSSQMYPVDYGRSQPHKSSTLPSAMFPSHPTPSNQPMHRPPSMMGSVGRPPSPPPAMRNPSITPPHQSISHSSSNAPGSRSPGKPTYGPPPPPLNAPGLPSQPPSSTSSNHLRSSGSDSHRSGIPVSSPASTARVYSLPKPSGVSSSLSTMGPPLPPLNSMNDVAKTERPPPSSHSGPMPPSVPVPVPPPTQLPPVQKYGHGLASKLFGSSGITGGGAPTGGRSASG